MYDEAEFSRSMGIARQSECNVLICGATGTGKSVLAREIHDTGKKAGRPFVVINLATLHEGTIESELFGHERGSFTGADSKRVGRLESANGGTVFLDEIGELPLRLQARLLDFMQSKRITPVGSSREVRLDVRIIAATHRDLEKGIRNGAFREDLFHRLRVVSIFLRPLLERAEHFDQILHACIEAVARETSRTITGISDEVACAFEAYAWPGNLRELRHVLEYAILASPSERIEADDLPHWFKKAAQAQPVELAAAEAKLGVAEVPLSLDFHESVSRFEKEFLSRAIARYRGRINLTARKTGIGKATLIRRLRGYGIHPGALAAVE